MRRIAWIAAWAFPQGRGPRRVQDGRLAKGMKSLVGPVRNEGVKRALASSPGALLRRFGAIDTHVDSKSDLFY
jgi:hypothetical protein